VARWAKGEAVVEQLLSQRQLDRVSADQAVAAELLAGAGRHVESGRAVAGSDLEGAYVLAYDAARKAATALLALQGLRPTTAGGHIAVVEAIRAQFPDVPGLKSLDRLRRRRNDVEYPDPGGHDPLSAEELDEALSVADQAVASARRLADSGAIGVF
jgi:hypothetical protein